LVFRFNALTFQRITRRQPGVSPKRTLILP